MALEDANQYDPYPVCPSIGPRVSRSSLVFRPLQSKYPHRNRVSVSPRTPEDGASQSSRKYKCTARDLDFAANHAFFVVSFNVRRCRLPAFTLLWIPLPRTQPSSGLQRHAAEDGALVRDAAGPYGEVPEHRFACNQAQQYKWFYGAIPTIFTPLATHVCVRKFHPTGGAWVEHDGNMPSGEAFVRQPSTLLFFLPFRALRAVPFTLCPAFDPLIVLRIHSFRSLITCDIAPDFCVCGPSLLSFT
ncbi:hypothetical protein C8R44DRAFT_887929 [Mycena epipterygia]|nr:hypothetical protein C8R44DRAFT_887929 [Mycena epipterygia]